MMWIWKDYYLGKRLTTNTRIFLVKFLNNFKSENNIQYFSDIFKKPEQNNNTLSVYKNLFNLF